MKKPTYKSIEEAAKKSKRAAIKSGKQKYLYLMSLTQDQVKKLSQKFLQHDGCAVCLRYRNGKNCPFEFDCQGCISEWQNMFRAWTDFKRHGLTDDYHEFITYAAKVYLKLLRI